MTIADARISMVKSVVAEFENGCAVPEISMKVDFFLLGDTEEYRQYRHLEPLFVYDSVRVRHKRLGILATVNLTGITWSVRRERVREADFGALDDMTSHISGWQISGMSGSKILPETIGSGHLEAETVSARHMQADSVNTTALQASCVTAAKLDAGSVNAWMITALAAAINQITAGTISTNTLAAAYAHLFELVAGNIRAGTVTADALDAVMASVVAAQFQAGEFDLATVTNLLASALVLEQGTADSMYITNLAITSANLLNATVGRLVIRGEDGGYWEVGVGADGVLRTAEYEPTQAEIEAGETVDGRKICEESIDAEEITGRTVKAAEAALGRVLASALTAGQITANEALLASASIPALYTTSLRALGNTIDISANQSIMLATGQAEAAQQSADDLRQLLDMWYVFSAEGLRTQRRAQQPDGSWTAASKWSTLVDETGFHVDHADVAGHVGSFARDSLMTRGYKLHGSDISVRRTAKGGWVWTDAE